MSKSLMDRMGNIQKAVDGRLDNIPKLMGGLSQPRLPLQDYLLQAQEYAARDPEFAAKLARAVQQYQAAANAARVIQEKAHASNK